MKKLLITSIFLTLVASLAYAQIRQTPQQTKPVVEQKAAPPSPIAEHFIKKYTIATRWNDLEVSKNALYDLIIEYPGNDSLIFSLALFYYENQKFPSSVLICQDLLTRNPKNVGALELVAESYQGLNLPDKALPNYEGL